MKEFENYDGYKKELSLLYPVPLGVTIENGINRVHVKTKKRKFTAQIGMRGNQQAIRVMRLKKFYGAGWNIRLRTIGNTRLTALYNLAKK